MLTLNEYCVVVHAVLAFLVTDNQSIFPLIPLELFRNSFFAWLLVVVGLEFGMIPLAMGA